MPAILEIPEVRQRVSRLAVEEYHRSGEVNESGRRTELIRGILIEKMSRSPLHSFIASRLYELIAPLLPQGMMVRREDPLTVADSKPEPDSAVVQGVPANFASAHPETARLGVEVALTSPSLDPENASLSAEAGATEYLVVLGSERQVEVYRQISPNTIHKGFTSTLPPRRSATPSRWLSAAPACSSLSDATGVGLRQLICIRTTSSNCESLNSHSH